MDDFAIWSDQKRRMEQGQEIVETFVREGSVWIIALGRNIGFEQNGAGDQFLRPVLVVKKFNNHMAWVVPLSTKQKTVDFYFNYTDHKGRDVSAILAQLRLISLKRLQRKLYDLDRIEFDKVKSVLRTFLY